MAMVRQTWDQVRIKAAMGLFRGLRSFRTRFHWKFWQPLNAIGGKTRHSAHEQAVTEPSSSGAVCCASVSTRTWREAFSRGDVVAVDGEIRRALQGLGLGPVPIS